MTNRESRHLKINGLSEDSTEDSILNYFANFGKVQKIEFLNDEKSSAVVSFMDLRSAANAVSKDRHDLKGQSAPLKVCYFESVTAVLDNSDVSSSEKQQHKKHINHKGSKSTVNRRNSSSDSSNSRRTLSRSLNSDSSRSRSRSLARSKSPSGSTSQSTSSRNEGGSRHSGSGRRPTTSRRVAANDDRRLNSNNENDSRRSSQVGLNPTSKNLSSASKYSTNDQQGRHFNSPKESSRNRGSIAGDNGSNSSSSNRHSAILVRNLPVRSTDSSLKDGLFFTYKKHGKVVSVKVVGEGNDRYAIVTFRKYYGNSDIRKAIDATNNIMFFGSKINVEQAPANFLDLDDNERKPLEKDIDQFHPRSSRTLYVGNLENRATPDQLRHFFERFGDVVDVDIKNRDSPAPFAFVQFTDILSVVKAIHAMEQDGYIGNNKVKVGFGKPLPSPMVWMCELPDHVSSEYLSRKMNFYGAITDILIDKVLHQSLITYDCIESAQAAVQDMKGRTVCNRKVQIDFCSRELHDLFVDRMFRTNQLRGREAAVYLTTSADGAVLTATTSAAPGAGAGGGAVVQTAAAILPPPPLPSTRLQFQTIHRLLRNSACRRHLLRRVCPQDVGGNIEAGDFPQTDYYYSGGTKSTGKRNDTTKKRNDAQYESRHSRPSNTLEDHESREGRQKKHRGRSLTPPPVPNRRPDDKLPRNTAINYRRTGVDDRPPKSQQQQQSSVNNRGFVRESSTSASRHRRRSSSPASRNGGGRSAPFSPRTPPETRRRQQQPSASQHSSQGRRSRRDRSPVDERDRRYSSSRHSNTQNRRRRSRRSSSSSSDASDGDIGGNVNEGSSSVSSRSSVSSCDDDRNSIDGGRSSSVPTPTFEDISSSSALNRSHDRLPTPQRVVVAAPPQPPLVLPLAIVPPPPTMNILTATAAPHPLQPPPVIRIAQNATTLANFFTSSSAGSGTTTPQTQHIVKGTVTTVKRIIPDESPVTAPSGQDMNKLNKKRENILQMLENLDTPASGETVLKTIKKEPMDKATFGQNTVDQKKLDIKKEDMKRSPVKDHVKKVLSSQIQSSAKGRSTKDELHDVSLQSSSNDRKQILAPMTKNDVPSATTAKASLGSTASTSSHGHKIQSRRIPLEALPHSGVKDPRSDPPNIKLNVNLPLPHFATKRHSGAVPFPTSSASTKTLSGSSRFDFKNDIIHSTALPSSGTHSQLQRQLSSSGSDVSTSHPTAPNITNGGIFHDPDLNDDLMSPPPPGSASFSTANGLCPWSSSSVFGVGSGDASLPPPAPTTDIFGESLSPIGPGDRVRASFEERIRALDDKFVELDRMIRVTKERPAHRTSVDYSKYKVIKKTSSASAAAANTSASSSSSTTAPPSILPQQSSPFTTNNVNRTTSSSSDLNTPSSSSSSKFSLPTTTLAKSSVFDQDAERLSSIEEKYTAKPYTSDLLKVKVEETSQRTKTPLTINIPQPALTPCQETLTAAPPPATTPSTPLSPTGNPIQGILKKTSTSGGVPPKTPTLAPHNAQPAFVLPVSPQDPRTVARRESAILSPTSLPKSDPRLGRSLSVSGPSPTVSVSPSTSTTTPSTSANTPQKAVPDTPSTPVKPFKPEKSPSILIPTSTCAPTSLQKTIPLQTKTPLSKPSYPHESKTSFNQVRTYCSHVNLTSTPTITSQFQKTTGVGDPSSLTNSPSVVTKELRNKELDELFNNSGKIKSDPNSVDCLKKNRPIAVDKEKAQLPKIMKKPSTTSQPTIKTESSERKTKVDEEKAEKTDKTKKDAQKPKIDSTVTSKKQSKSSEKDPRQPTKKRDEKTTTSTKQSKEETMKKTSSVNQSSKASNSKLTATTKKSDKSLKTQSSAMKNLKTTKKQPSKIKRRRTEKYESDESSQETDGDEGESDEENKKIKNKSDDDSEENLDEESGSESSSDDDDGTDSRTKKDRKIAKNLEKEWKKILQEAGEPVGLSMYDRVKRRSSAVNQTSSSKNSKNKENKKSEKSKFDKLREIRREKNIKKKSAPKRIKCGDSSSDEASSATEHTADSDSEKSDSENEKETTKVEKTVASKRKESSIPSKLSSNDLFSSDASTSSAQSSNEEEKEDETTKKKSSKTSIATTKKPTAVEKHKSQEKSSTKQKQQAAKKRRREESDENSAEETASSDEEDRKPKRKIEKTSKPQEKAKKIEENRKRRLSESSNKEKTITKRNKTANEEQQKSKKETNSNRFVSKGAKKEIAPSTTGRADESSGDATVKQHVLVTKAAKKALDFGSMSTETVVAEKPKTSANEDDDDAVKGAIQTLDNVEISADIVEALKRSIGEDVDLNETTEFDAPVELSVQEVIVAEETDTPATTEPASPLTANTSVANIEVKNKVSEKENDLSTRESEDKIKSPHEKTATSQEDVPKETPVVISEDHPRPLSENTEDMEAAANLESANRLEESSESRKSSLTNEEPSCLLTASAATESSVVVDPVTDSALCAEPSVKLSGLTIKIDETIENLASTHPDLVSQKSDGSSSHVDEVIDGVVHGYVEIDPEKLIQMSVRNNQNHQQNGNNNNNAGIQRSVEQQQTPRSNSCSFSDSVMGASTGVMSASSASSVKPPDQSPVVSYADSMHLGPTNNDQHFPNFNPSKKPECQYSGTNAAKSEAEASAAAVHQITQQMKQEILQQQQAANYLLHQQQQQQQFNFLMSNQPTVVTSYGGVGAASNSNNNNAGLFSSCASQQKSRTPPQSYNVAAAGQQASIVQQTTKATNQQQPSVVLGMRNQQQQMAAQQFQAGQYMAAALYDAQKQQQQHQLTQGVQQVPCWPTASVSSSTAAVQNLAPSFLGASISRFVTPTPNQMDLQQQQQQQEMKLREQQQRFLLEQQRRQQQMVAAAQPQVFAQAPQPQQQRVVVQQEPTYVNHRSLLERYPVIWQGHLALKNDQALVQMHLVSGNPQLLPHSLPMANERSPIPELRIMQRMRLEAQQLDGVTRRMQLREEHCILVALPCGQDRNHIMDQSNILNSAFINYLQQKQAAGIVHVAPVGSTSTQPAYIVHVFPPCDFAQQALMSTACDFFQSILDRQTAFLFVVVTTAQQT